MTEAVTDTPAFPMARGGCPFDLPPALVDRMHSEPISRVKIWDGSTPWLLTRYGDVRAILADPRASVNTEMPGFPNLSRGNAARAHIRAFINMDDPEHAAQRRLLTSDFMVKKMEAMRPRIQEIVNQLIDEMLAGPRPVDLVEAFALPLPSMVISELLGIPYADRDFFHKMSRLMVSRTATGTEAIDAAEQLTAYVAELAESKIAAPGDDLLSRLALEQLHTGRMTRDQVGGMGRLLILAGHESTANMIALSTAALLEHPDQLAIIRESDDPKVIASSVEELLRYLTILHIGIRRIALEDIEIAGQLIRRGEGIVLALDAANRQDMAFPDPNTLDVTRDARHHVAFGHGIHVCLGQPLARVELQVVYRTLFRRIPTLTLAKPVEQLNFKNDMFVYGLYELPVTW